jgi:two-component system response regulator QseB
MDEEVGEHGQLLLIEDDPTLVMLLSQLLAEEGYALDVARDGQRGLHLALTRSYDAVILDRGLPVLDGIDLLTRLRSTGFTTPVLILSALSNPADRVRGLDAGAEDYLSKPFNVDELLARLRALRRRHLDTARALPIGKASLNIETRQVVTDAERESIRLSERECDLLAVLARRPTRVFTRRDLLDLAFPEAESEAVVDTYIHYLRKKLGRAVITTVHGRGYQLGSA